MAPNVGLGSHGQVQRGWGLWLTSVLAVVIAGFFVAARLAQRFAKKSGIGLDDYMIIAALVSSVLLTVTECQAVVYGYGHRYATLPPDTRITARKWFYGANTMYKVVLMFNKLSVVCLYYRIFAVSKKSFRVLCHVMNAWIVVSGLAFILATIFQCTPIAAFWDRSIVGFKCFKNEPWWISYATTQIVTDFVLLTMPVPRVLKLSMGRAEKLGIVLIFGTGGFVTFASIYRATTIAGSANDPDPTWGPIPATIWSVVEANTGIICACLPMLRYPFVRLFGPLLGSHRTTTQARSYQLSKRSERPQGVSAVVQQGQDLYHSDSDLERDSEDGIIKERSFSDQKTAGQSRRGSEGILVTHKSSIVANEAAKKRCLARSEGQDEYAVATRSVAEDEPDRKSPYLHI